MNGVMDEELDRKPIQLKLVSMPTHLGDLSGMSPTERAELVEQDGRRKIMEEMLIGEAGALRQFFWASGIWCGGICAAVVSSYLLDGVLSPSYSNPMILIVPLRILVVVGFLAGVIAIYPAIWFAVCWIKAMRRRRRFLSTGQLMQKR